MIIALVHGYLLRGTGSNLYVSNLCRTFCRQGHRVLLFSQEETPDTFDFITGSYRFAEDNQTTVCNFERRSSYTGNCIHYRSNLGGLLPVYVYDHYPEFKTVKEFPDLNEAEIEDYLERNRIALETVFRQEAPDLIISQHTIMQPVYAARALSALQISSYRHLITVHGSALNFSVRKSSLLRRYALEGIDSASGLVFISDHSRSDFITYFSDLPDLKKRCRVIYAGVNTELFQPLESMAGRKEMIAKLAVLLHQAAQKSGRGKSSREKEEFYQKLKDAADAAAIAKLITASLQRSDIWAPDLDAADSLAGINWSSERIVLYHGKYLWTKGIHLLLAAAPLVLQKHPQTRFILVGFGSAREYLEALTGLFDQGRLDFALEMLAHPLEFDSSGAGEPSYSKGLFDLLSNPLQTSRYREAGENRLARQVIFTGIMDHEQLRHLIPCADVVVAPSIFPEAFGLVAIEALACGVLPVQTYHSGFADVVDIYQEQLHDIMNAAGVNKLPLDENLVLGLANNITAILNYLDTITEDKRTDLARRTSQLVADTFSWDTIARRYLQG